MLIVHHLNNSRSQRIVWMLEELGLDYEIRRYRRNSDMSAPKELKAIHPLGKSPILEDISADGQRTAVVETGAICDYLVERANGRLGPDHASDRILYRQFLHYAEGSVMPILLAMLVASKIPIMGRAAIKRVQPMLDTHLDFVESQLASRQWFAGERITAADIMMSFPLEAARARGRLGSARPFTTAWLDRIHARPAYITALEKGGPYAFAT
ncbi:MULTISPECIES: glutathione S-transferase family protein [Rhizobium]|uniref:glutathione transferase n=1 Tax=Rhizobium wenxiniae TaxID=1737357 RepID=A0A7X0D256_9HYPH|nr:glutathione S-transferase [Rhizobium wenxiniae]MBB6164773.1 glutathione S-transferase [Rhizobium wenxiniae]